MAKKRKAKKAAKKACAEEESRSTPNSTLHFTSYGPVSVTC